MYLRNSARLSTSGLEGSSDGTGVPGPFVLTTMQLRYAALNHRTDGRTYVKQALDVVVG